MFLWTYNSTPTDDVSRKIKDTLENYAQAADFYKEFTNCDGERKIQLGNKMASVLYHADVNAQLIKSNLIQRIPLNSEGHRNLESQLNFIKRHPNQCQPEIVRLQEEKRHLKLLLSQKKHDPPPNIHDECVQNIEVRNAEIRDLRFDLEEYKRERDRRLLQAPPPNDQEMPGGQEVIKFYQEQHDKDLENIRELEKKLDEFKLRYEQLELAHSEVVSRLNNQILERGDADSNKTELEMLQRNHSILLREHGELLEKNIALQEAKSRYDQLEMKNWALRDANSELQGSHKRLLEEFNGLQAKLDEITVDGYVKNSLRRIEAIQIDAIEFEKDVEEFRGGETDKAYLRLKEMLIRKTIEIDAIESKGLMEILSMKREVMGFIQLLMGRLQQKIN